MSANCLHWSKDKICVSRYFRKFENQTYAMSLTQRLLLLLILLSPVYLPAQDKKPGSSSRRQFIEDARIERDAKNLEFLDTTSSLIPHEQIRNFKGLNYFRANPAYKVTATLHVENHLPVHISAGEKNYN